MPPRGGARGATLRVDGYREFMVLVANSDKESKRAIRDEFRKAGEHVRAEGSSLFGRYDAKSAAGYRVVVRRRGIAVEQRYRKTTGLRPDFGALQMRRALVPALYHEEDNTMRALEEAFDRIAARFNSA